MPATNLTVFVAAHDSPTLQVIASVGVGAGAVSDLNIAVGDRISGWVFAHKQPVVNSNAALELGGVARTLAAPLRYALAVPNTEGRRRPTGGRDLLLWRPLHHGP